MADDVQKNRGVLIDGSTYFAAAANEAQMVYLQNKSGGSLTTGDVVVLSTSDNLAVVTNTVQAAARPAFVVPYQLGTLSGNDNVQSTKTVAADEWAWFYRAGAIVPAANYDGGALSRGEFLVLSSTAKRLTGSGVVVGNDLPPSGAVAIALEGKTSSSGQVAVALLQLDHAGQVYAKSALMPLASVTLTESASSIEFTNIPDVYHALQLVGLLRSTDASSTDNLLITYSGDTTGANYTRRQVVLADSYSTDVSSDRRIGIIPAANAPSNAYAAVDILIPHYTSTSVHKTARSIVALHNGTNERVLLYDQRWMSTSAITSIKLTPSTGSFRQHSSIALYGMRVAS